MEKKPKTCKVVDLKENERYALSLAYENKYIFIVKKIDLEGVYIHFVDGVPGYFNFKNLSRDEVYELPFSSLEKELL